MSQAAQPNAQVNAQVNSRADTPAAAGVAVLGRVLISAIFLLSGASKLAAPAAMTAWSRISQREPFSENTAAFSPGSSPSSCTAFRPTSMASASSAYE